MWDVGELAPKGEDGSKGSVGFSARLRTGLPAETVIANQAVVYFPSVPEETPTNVTVNVVRPVAAIPQSLTTPAAVPLAITLAGREATGLPLTFSVVSPPLGGTLAGTPPQLTYTADVTYSGTDTLTFVASNGTDESRPAVVQIAVTPSPEDTTTPQIDWTWPEGGETLGDLPLKAISSGAFGPLYGPLIVVQLSKALDAATVGDATVSVTDSGGRPVAVLVDYDETVHQITITMNERWQATTYTVTLSTSLTDAAGNHLEAPYAWSFSAKPAGLIRERLYSVP